LKPFMLIVRLVFVAAAIAVLISGISWWIYQRPAQAKALQIKNASPIAYAGNAPVSKSLAQTLSSYKSDEKEKKLFQDFSKAEETGNKNIMRTMLKNMSNSYKNAGEQELAVQIDKQAVTLGRSTGEHKEVGQSLQDIGEIYHKAGNYDKSVDYDKQALSEYQTIDANKEIVRVLHHLCNNYKSLGKFDEAMACLKKANKIVAGMHGEITKHAKKLAGKVQHNEDSGDEPQPTPRTGVGRTKKGGSSAGDSKKTPGSGDEGGKHGGSEDNGGDSGSSSGGDDT
jgi:tetratricopeptide (TPR) repeat protein